MVSAFTWQGKNPPFKRKALKKRGIQVRKFLNAGAFAIIFEDSMGRAVRLESIKYSDGSAPLKHPIALTPMEDGIGLHMGDDLVGPDDLDVRMRIYLKGENLGTIGVDDVLRTAAVLKHSGELEHWNDVNETQLMYLRGEDGDYLRYWPESGADFAGHPIAYIVDPGTIPKTSKSRKIWAGAGNAIQHIAKKLGVSEEEAARCMPNATYKEILACSGQYALIDAVKQKAAFSFAAKAMERARSGPGRLQKRVGEPTYFLVKL